MLRPALSPELGSTVRTNAKRSKFRLVRGHSLRACLVKFVFKGSSTSFQLARQMASRAVFPKIVPENALLLAFFDCRPSTLDFFTIGAPFLQADGLAGTFPQVVELGPTNHAASLDFHLDDSR